MKVLFVTADLGGNIPPTLAVAEAVARRGIDVEIAGLRGGRTSLTHVPFERATAIRPEGHRQGLREFGALRRLMISAETSTAAAALVRERRIDVVVVDCMLPAPLRGAIASGVPVVALFHTVGSFWIDSFDRGAIGRFFGAVGLRPSSLWEHASARLLLTDRDLDPGRDDPRLRGYEWTGTTEAGTEPLPRGTPSRVLVALSSTTWPGMLAVYRRIIDALSSLAVEAVVTTGGVELGGPLPTAANVEVHGWVPHAELLPTVDLVIGHGGHSTTMKTLAHGVPLLILPVNPTSDQRMIAHIVQSAGAGRWLQKSASPSRIRSEVQGMIGDDALRRRAAQIGNRLRAAPSGAEVAADRIVALRTRTD